MVNYDDLSKEALVEVLKRRDALARYGLRWERDRIEHDQSLNRDFAGLELQPELCVGNGPWKNLIIEGDNFDALRHLATTHAGAFHCIYIDPPYNTGRRDFVYNDHFFESSSRYRHSTWLEFMYQRLTLAKCLLREDGALVASIDDNEVANFRLLLNQVFGERSFVATCIWQKRYSRENREAIGDVHEYLLVYSPNPKAFKARRGRLPLTEEQSKVYRNPNNDPKGRWRSVPMTAQIGNATEDQFYEVVTPKGVVHKPSEGRCWGISKATYDQLLADGRIYFGKDDKGQPNIIRYLTEVDGVVPWTWWPHEEVGHTDEANKEVQELFGSQTVFDTAKPLRLMQRVLNIFAPEDDALVLDFFAGSGTTGQAVLKMNAEVGGDRRFVLVSSRESTAENPTKNLCRDVCRTRILKATEGYQGADGLARPALGGSAAYLVAKRVPMHRFEEGLSDAMVWAFALEACGHPMSVGAPGVSTSIHGDHLVAYCSNTRASTLEQLKVIVQAHNGRTAVITWAPDAINGALGPIAARISVVSIPQDLKRAFKQGNTRIAQAAAAAESVDNDDGPPPAPSDFSEAVLDQGSAAA